MCTFVIRPEFGPVMHSAENGVFASTGQAHFFGKWSFLPQQGPLTVASRQDRCECMIWTQYKCIILIMSTQTMLLERQKTRCRKRGITSRDRSAEGDFCTTHHTSGMHEKMSDQRANQACKQTIWTHTACPNIQNTSRSCVDASLQPLGKATRVSTDWT